MLDESSISLFNFIFISPILVFALIGAVILFKLYTSDEILFNSSFFNGNIVFPKASRLIDGASIDFSIDAFL